jgi:deazaflavin-dependent oxidoreductase (nitroreductase family)
MARTRVTWLRPLAVWFNPVSRLVAGWLPYFGILSYRGRRSGRAYRIPINVFRRGDRFLFFLTYGSDAQWVMNVRAAGECEIRTGGHDFRLIEPELIVDPSLPLMPWPVRLAGRIASVTEVLQMREAP